jgi:hypothetical protein
LVALTFNTSAIAEGMNVTEAIWTVVAASLNVSGIASSLNVSAERYSEAVDASTTFNTSAVAAGLNITEAALVEAVHAAAPPVSHVEASNGSDVVFTLTPSAVTLSPTDGDIVQLLLTYSWVQQVAVERKPGG